MNHSAIELAGFLKRGARPFAKGMPEPKILPGGTRFQKTYFDFILRAACESYQAIANTGCSDRIFQFTYGDAIKLRHIIMQLGQALARGAVNEETLEKAQALPALLNAVAASYYSDKAEAARVLMHHYEAQTTAEREKFHAALGKRDAAAMADYFPGEARRHYGDGRTEWPQNGRTADELLRTRMKRAFDAAIDWPRSQQCSRLYADGASFYPPVIRDHGNKMAHYHKEAETANQILDTLTFTIGRLNEFLTPAPASTQGAARPGREAGPAPRTGIADFGEAAEQAGRSVKPKRKTADVVTLADFQGTGFPAAKPAMP